MSYKYNRLHSSHPKDKIVNLGPTTHKKMVNLVLLLFIFLM